MWTHIAEIAAAARNVAPTVQDIAVLEALDILVDLEARLKEDTGWAGLPDIVAAFRVVYDAADQSDWLRLKRTLTRFQLLRDVEKAIKAVQTRESTRVTTTSMSTSGKDPLGQQLLPAIQVNNRPVPDVSNDALIALRAANNPPKIFVRGGELTRIRSDENGRPIIECLTEPILSHHLARMAEYLRVRTQGAQTQVRLLGSCCRIS